MILLVHHPFISSQHEERIYLSIPSYYVLLGINPLMRMISLQCIINSSIKVFTKMTMMDWCSISLVINSIQYSIMIIIPSIVYCRPMLAMTEAKCGSGQGQREVQKCRMCDLHWEGHM